MAGRGARGEGFTVIAGRRATHGGYDPTLVDQLISDYVDRAQDLGANMLEIRDACASLEAACSDVLGRRMAAKVGADADGTTAD